MRYYKQKKYTIKRKIKKIISTITDLKPLQWNSCDRERDWSNKDHSCHSGHSFSNNQQL